MGLEAGCPGDTRDFFCRRLRSAKSVGEFGLGELVKRGLEIEWGRELMSRRGRRAPCGIG